MSVKSVHLATQLAPLQILPFDVAALDSSGKLPGLVTFNTSCALSSV